SILPYTWCRMSPNMTSSTCTGVAADDYAGLPQLMIGSNSILALLARWRLVVTVDEWPHSARQILASALILSSPDDSHRGSNEISCSCNSA
ncbi:hypothetical protein PMAYCL1PPCAC_20329, partial [Pristionchus mayeri]